MSRGMIRRSAIILLIALSLLFNTYNLFDMVKNRDPNAALKNEVSIWENRLHSMRQELPADVEQIGYAADWDLPGVKYESADQDNEFRLTKYVLAPVIVNRGLEYEWIVGNFSQHRFEDWLRGEIGEYQLKEIGGGVYLIHRVQP